MDKRLHPTQISSDERSKHAYYCQKAADEVRFMREVGGDEVCYTKYKTPMENVSSHHLLTGVTMTLLRRNGRVVQSILGSRDLVTARNWYPTSHLASLARRRGLWYPVG